MTEDALMRLFVHGLQRQKACYEQMGVLAARQRELIEKGKADALMELIGQKQKFVRELEDIEKELMPTKERWQTIRQTISPASRGRVEDEMGQVRAVLENLIALENEMEKTMVASRDHAQDRLKHIQKGSNVPDAYRKPKQSGGFLDSRS